MAASAGSSYDVPPDRAHLRTPYFVSLDRMAREHPDWQIPVPRPDASLDALRELHAHALLACRDQRARSE